MNLRFKALELTTERSKRQDEVLNNNQLTASESFGKYVFTRSLMQKMLPKDIFNNLIEASEGKGKIKPEYSDTIAVAMKEWAVSLGATHYTHWFQPLTGATAEKHDAFIEWSTPDKVIERFSGEQLLQGEPDASSFPSGGLRSTYEARGYTGWDPSSPVFVWKAGDGATLCIPSVFFSWTGDVLDTKIPLLRSDKMINQSVLRLLKMTGSEANSVYSSVGLEQEYFVVDKALRDRRPDLCLAGRTVFGAPSPKGQELQDHYFGSVKDRILRFMSDFESAALQLAIPVKTRHNEVAPSQHEVAPVFERSSIAVDHNLLLMELMRKIALKHNLSCLLHEKPFHDLNGSGKHCNWSLVTDGGANLLDPKGEAGSHINFLVILTAILHAVHEHSGLLRSSVGSSSNDCRLGGHEAPPAIISIYLGQDLEEYLNNIEKNGSSERKSGKGKYDFGIPVIPDLSKDQTDRNRTSPFAFTGNKFEFRALGSSQNPAGPVTILNTIVADSLNQILDEVESNLKKKKQAADAFIPVIQKFLKKSKNIRFSGDNYSADWVKEAKKRKLPNLPKCVESFKCITSKSTIDALKGVLNRHELESRRDILLEQYIESINIEVKLMVDMFKTQILPAGLKTQKKMSESIHAFESLSGVSTKLTKQKNFLKRMASFIEESLQICEALEKVHKKGLGIKDLSKKADFFAFDVLEQCSNLRSVVDQLEAVVDDTYWAFPKYHEILFMT